MTDSKAAEPSIEEILASIRKIISDDEPDAAEAASSEGPQDEQDVLELTDVVFEVSRDEPEPAAPPPPVAPVQEIKPAPAPPPLVEAPPVVRDDGEIETLASAETVAAASGAFARLTHVDPPSLPALPVSSGGKSVEDIVRELLKPMLRQWIDQNLTGIVERLVEHELRKISRKSEEL